MKTHALLAGLRSMFPAGWLRTTGKTSVAPGLAAGSVSTQ
jgi:hypothetical protein